MKNKKIFIVALIITTILISSILCAFVSASNSPEATTENDATIASDITNASDLLSMSDEAEVYTYDGIVCIENVKQNIFDNMLNSVDFYNSVEGEFLTTFLDCGKEVSVVYKTDIDQQMSYQKISSATINTEQYYNDNAFTTYDNTKKVYTTERYISQYDKLNRSALNKNICVEKNNNFQFFNGKTFSKERIGVAPDGENAYYYRADITNTGVATTSIFSQELVFGFLSNQENWTITGVEEYLDRQVVVLSGKVTDDYYSSKLNVKTFEMRVDINTGILLDLKAYSPKGDLSQYVTTKNIIIDSFSSDLKSFLDNSINSKGSEYSLRVAIC